MVRKHKARTLLDAAIAQEEHEKLMRQVAASRRRVEETILAADKHFKPSIIGSVLGKPTGWVVARRDGKRWPRLDREQEGPGS